MVCEGAMLAFALCTVCFLGSAILVAIYSKLYNPSTRDVNNRFQLLHSHNQYTTVFLPTIMLLVVCFNTVLL